MKLLVLLFLFTGCSGLFYHPQQGEVQNPSQFNMLHKNYYFKTRDGVLLHSWKIFAKQNAKPKGTIIFFHGNAENISTHFYNLAWLTEHSYDIFIFDYRGYGKSYGEPDQKGTYLDGLAALNEGVNWAISRSSKKIVVYGQSLGGIIAARSLIDFNRQNEIKLLVLDSTFSSYNDLAFDKLTSNWLTFLISPLAYLLVSDEMGVKSLLPKYRIPKLIIHGTDDDIVPFKFGEEINKLSSNPKWFWKVDQGKHTNAFFIENGKYRRKFLKFLDKNI